MGHTKSDLPGASAAHFETASSESDLEKTDLKKLDSNLNLGATLQAGEDVNLLAEKRLVRKTDWRLLPLAGLLLAVSLLDRLNLPNARLAGMDKALGMSIGDRYSLVTMVFFIGYIICDFPANFIIRKTGPALFLGVIAFCWGVLTLAMGFSKSWTDLLILRIFFGCFEGGLFPGLIYLLSSWYRRDEVQLRFSVFYGIGMFASGLNSLICYGLSKMDGLGGLEGWQWIFVMYGLITIFIAVLALLFLVDFPEKAGRKSVFGRPAFLTPEEVSVMLARIQRDRGDAIPEKVTFHSVCTHLRDWKIWEFGILLLCNNCTAYSFAYFLPLILRGMGFSLEMTYILVLPPYILAVIWMLITALVGDKFMSRGPIIVFNAVFTLIGVCMMGFVQGNVTRYAGVFLAIAPFNSSIPAIFAYQHNNIVGQTKRAIGAAVMIACAGVGGIIASNAFAQKDAPKYLPGLYTVIGMQGLTILIVCKNVLFFTRQNRRAARGEIVLEGKEGFRYTL